MGDYIVLIISCIFVNNILLAQFPMPLLPLFPEKAWN